MALDRVHLARGVREHRGGVARARADLEHALAALELERFRHVSDDVRLRDRLPFADRQRRVGVRELAHLLAHEFLARHLAHRARHCRGADTTFLDLMRHHVAAQCAQVGHFCLRD